MTNLSSPTQPSKEQPEPILLEEREGVWIFLKPSGFAVHPTNDPNIPDLISWSHEQGFSAQEMAPIHRIDRDTSGIVLCSPDASIRGEFGAWFAQGRVEKEYLALVFGETRKKGVIKKTLFDRRRKKPLEALTHYEQIECLGGFSFLQIQPKTGRKHQIRQHLQMIGHSIVGDTRYRPKRFRKVPAFPGRLWLHAHQISLPNGWVFEAPLPTALSAHLAHLRAFESSS